MVKRQLSESARAGKMIRDILKKQFPTTKFSVGSRNFAGGDAVDIGWSDGATQKSVEKFTKKNKYQRKIDYALSGVIKGKYKRKGGKK